MVRKNVNIQNEESSVKNGQGYKRRPNKRKSIDQVSSISGKFSLLSRLKVHGNCFKHNLNDKTKMEDRERKKLKPNCSAVA